MPIWLKVILIVAGAIALIAGLFRYIRYRMNLERSFNMVFLDIRVPKRESKEDREIEGESYSTQKDFKEISGGVMTQFFESLHSLYTREWYKIFTSQDFLSFEYAVLDGQVRFFIVCPRSLVEQVEKQLTAFYPESHVEQVEDYNIFQPKCKVESLYIIAKKNFWFPFKTFSRMTADPLNSIINSLSKIGKDEGAAIQIMVRPRKDGWQKKGRKVASKIFQSKGSSNLQWFNPLSWISSFFELIVRGESVQNMDKDGVNTRTTPITDEEVKAIEEKNAKSGFETIIRVVSSAATKKDARDNILAMRGAFSQFNTTNANQLDYTRWHSNKTLVSNFIFRNFRRGIHQFVLR
ncbi:MAG: hypothetical protein O3B47_03805, partial [bacterium]|nr:hypothetical protein [bacterium]